jgi:hypothetical protein
MPALKIHFEKRIYRKDEDPNPVRKGETESAQNKNSQFRDARTWSVMVDQIGHNLRLLSSQTKG